ncbi:4-alpha-glucanotransferase [Halopseudomonas xinjiangensis]|uniref:4-alpha-glucanotransferase n=1 Tax=Halopseudomonas xinjiangensis TaxID=487184 RepID=A0A1H1VAK6_9GAMM|nr:4-alpha-glucanotransferase [Halopseudomonas xinjiangensis]SDS81670.1 4-alpha-glucanotransferase [Halopseudomonas xinjiangensis]
MSDALLEQLTRAAGLAIDWTDAFGKPQSVAPDNQRALLEALGYPAGDEQQIRQSLNKIEQQRHNPTLYPLLAHDQGEPLCFAGRFKAGQSYQLTLEHGEALDGDLDENSCLPGIDSCGYHHLKIAGQETTLAIAPPACPSVDDLTGREGARIWGITAQVYSLRRPGDGGLGDTNALASLCDEIAPHGADAIAISPLHAMFSADLHNYSPYSPSSRMFFNILHSSPELVLGQEAVDRAVEQCGLQEEMRRLEQLDLIDWPAASAVRLRLLRQLHGNFQASPGEAMRDLQAFIDQGGEALEQHCRFEALHAYMLEKGEAGDWRQWPAELRDPHGTAVQRFAREHQQDVDFHCFAQWLMTRSLEQTQRSALKAGMKIGLIADLAVGAHGAGSQTWTRQNEFLPQVTVGAPPDILNSNGQSWGISAFSPQGLKENGFRAFIEMLRANMAHAGGIRIDHVMGLKRLWVIPEGAPSDAGAYLEFPFEDLLRLISLEAWRNKALIIGEDLGTVPEGLREDLARRNLLGMRVLLFEQDDGRFIPPARWPADALATTTTHDLPSIKGWFNCRDIDARIDAGHRPAEQSEEDRTVREKEKTALEQLLREEGFLAGAADDDDARLDACVELLGSTPAPLALLPLEDVMGSMDQPNLPGPGDEHPNWRRRWPDEVGDMLKDGAITARLKRLGKARQATRKKAT